MNLKNIIVAGMLSTTALVSFAASAEESNNIYVQLNAGGSFGLAPKGDFGTKKAGTSGLFGVESGYQFDDHLRAGVSLDYRNKYSFSWTVPEEGVNPADEHKVKIKSLVAMVNLYYDITNVNGFTPYVTLGAGIARNKTTQDVTTSNVTDSQSGTKNNFAYKVGLGARYAINQNIDFDLRYQFVDLGKIKVKSTDELNAANGKLRAHEFLVGVAYKF